MNTLKRIGHFLLLVIAVLVIVLCAAGIYGTWYANRTITDVTLKVFSTVDTGVAVVENGVSQVDEMVQNGRTEVQQAETTITGVGANLQANSPVLTALSSRLETRLAPTVSKVQAALAPVHNALQTVDSVVEIANSIPFIREQVPAVERVDTVLNQLDQMAADVQQINDTLKGSVVEGKNQLTQEAVNTLTTLTTRVDNRLGEVQAEIQTVQTDLNALQDRLEARKSRLLLIYNLVALALTLLLVWLIYSQVVVIQKQWRGVRGAGTSETAVPPAPTPGETTEVAAPGENGGQKPTV